MTGSRLALLLTVAAGITACDSRPEPGAAAAPSTAAAEADQLGRELFQLVDRASDYQSSHRGRVPATIAQLGIDSLTPVTVRRMVSGATPPAVQVAFRKSAGHALVECQGDRSVLEEAALNEGHFSVICSGPALPSSTYRVGGH